MMELLGAAWALYGSAGIRSWVLFYSLTVAALVAFYGLRGGSSAPIKAMSVHHVGWFMSASLYAWAYRFGYPDWVNQAGNISSMIMAGGSTWLLLWLFGFSPKDLVRRLPWRRP